MTKERMLQITSSVLFNISVVPHKSLAAPDHLNS